MERKGKRNVANDQSISSISNLSARQPCQAGIFHQTVISDTRQAGRRASKQAGRQAHHWAGRHVRRQKALAWGTSSSCGVSSPFARSILPSAHRPERAPRISRERHGWSLALKRGSKPSCADHRHQHELSVSMHIITRGAVSDPATQQLLAPPRTSRVFRHGEPTRPPLPAHRHIPLLT